jgi:ubiquinone/menaquinone biosynthesis C-methylase UbiE
VLFGSATVGVIGQHHTHFLRRLACQLKEALFPEQGMACKYLARERNVVRRLATEDLGVAVSECQYTSREFGVVRLRTSEVPTLDPVTGHCVGSLVNFDVVDCEDHDRLRQQTIARWSHEILWEVYAASYDRVLPELWFYQEVVKRHCDAMASPAVKRVLDLGAGTGNVSLPLANGGKEVVAIDSSRAMLARMRDKSSASRLENLTIIEDTAESLPYLPDASFDGVTVLLALFDMQSRLAALRELQRVLRPGGMLILTEPKKCFQVEQLMASAEEWMISRRIRDRLADDWHTIESVAPLISQSIKRTGAASANDRVDWCAETVFEILQNDGFTNLTIEDSHLGNCATIRGLKPCSFGLH